MSNRFENPFDQMFGATADFLVGGKLYFYLTGSSTPSDTYSDPDLAPGHANANPVVLDAYGRHGAIFLDPAVTYKVVLKDADGVTIATADPVVDPAANTTAAFQVVAGNPNGQLAGNQGSLGGSSASVAWDITNNLLYVCDTTGTALTAVWVQVAANLSGAIVKSGVITPTALAASADNYTPTGGAAASTWRMSASADAVAITGISVSQVAGTEVLIENIGTTYPLILRTEHASSTAANRLTLSGDVVIRPKESRTLFYDGVSARWRIRGVANIAPISEPGGRLTLTSGTPVQAVDNSTATAIYYTPFRGLYVPLWNGVATVMVSIGAELSLALDSNAAHTGYHQSGKNFDLFVVDDAGTIRLVSGPAWTNDTTRATALELKNGFYVNAAAMTTRYDATATTLAVAQDLGLYVGTFRASADGQTAWVVTPAAAAGGTECKLFLWNTYHRRRVMAMSKDSTNTWTWNTASWHSADTSATWRVTAVYGLNEDAVRATFQLFCDTGNANGVMAAVGLDSTTAFSGYPGSQARSESATGGPDGSARGEYLGLPGIGSHFFQALEWGLGAASGTIMGDNNAPTQIQSALAYEGWA